MYLKELSKIFEHWNAQPGALVGFAGGTSKVYTELAAQPKDLFSDTQGLIPPSL